MNEPAGSSRPGPEPAPPEREAPSGADAAEGQVQEVRQRLVREAGAAGVDEQLVHAAVDEAAAAYARAPVQAFVGILVERAVREQLGLRAAPP